MWVGGPHNSISVTVMCRLTGQPHHSSYLVNSVVLRGHSSTVRTLPSTVTAALSTGALVRGNVLVESYDTSTVVVAGHHSLIEANLALGTIKDMTGGVDTCSMSVNCDTSTTITHLTHAYECRPQSVKGAHACHHHLPCVIRVCLRGLAAGKSSFDMLLPATYEVSSAAVNTSLVGNVAAGSHRLVSSAGW